MSRRWSEIEPRLQTAVLLGLKKAADQADAYTQRFAHRPDAVAENQRFGEAFRAAMELLQQSMAPSSNRIVDRLADELANLGGSLLGDAVAQLERAGSPAAPKKK